MKTTHTGRHVKSINEFIKNYSTCPTKMADVIAKRGAPKPDLINMDFALIEARAAAAWLAGEENHG